MNDSPVTAPRTAWAVAVAFLVAFAATTFDSLGSVTLWRDEMATRIFSGLSPASLWRATSHVDKVLRPYYLFIHYWRVFGDGPVALRFPSWIAGGATLLLIVWAAVTVWGIGAGAIAGGYLLLNPQFLYWASTARSYALVMLLMVVASLQVVRRTALPRLWLRAVTYGLCSCLAVALHPFAVFVVLAHLVAVLVTRAPDGTRRLAVVAAAPILLAGAILTSSSSQQRQAELAHGASVRDAVRVTSTLTGGAGLDALLVAAIVAGVLVQARRRRLDRLWVMAAALLVVPAAGLFVVSRVSGVELLERYDLIATGAVALLLGGTTALCLDTMTAVPRRVRAGVAGVLVGLVAVAGVPGASTMISGRFRTDDYAGTVAYLRRHLRAGDVLLIAQTYRSGGFAAGFAYYAHDRAFTSYVERALTNGGEPDVYARTVVRARPLTTVPYAIAALTVGPARRTWLATFLKVRAGERLPAAVTSVCPRGRTDSVAMFGDITVLGIDCERRRPPIE